MAAWDRLRSQLREDSFICDDRRTAWRLGAIVPEAVVQAADEEEVAATLAFASERGLTVIPRGGGTHDGFGPLPAHCDILLDTTRLDAIVAYEPADMVLTAQAGVRIAHLQERTAAAGQLLSLDPPWPRQATLGGAVATGASSHRRHRLGSARDAVLGLRVALADGRIITCGGSVVKNVAGYDMNKLFVGSLGGLGVITRVSLRVWPLPEASATVLVGMPTLTDLAPLLAHAFQPALAPAAVHVLPRSACPVAPSPVCLALLFEDFTAAVANQTEAAAGWAARQGATCQVLTAGEAEGLWQSLRDRAYAAGEAQLKVGLPRTEIAPFLRELTDTAADHNLAHWQADLGVGQVAAVLADAADERTQARIQRLRTRALKVGGYLVVTHAPAGFPGPLDVWGPPRANFFLMRGLKERLDPQRTLNPGRLIGGI